NHWTIGDRIGEGDTELDRIRSRTLELFDDANARVAIGNAARDVGDETTAFLSAQAFEERRDTIHCAPFRAGEDTGAPPRAATCGTSLSPRPDRFKTTEPINPGPLRSSQPNAWADSSAGMIPSV